MNQNMPKSTSGVNIVISRQDSDKKSKVSFSKEKSSITIGRDGKDSDRDIRLKDHSKVLSREHTEIRRVNQQYEIKDTSRNHTWLNNESDPIPPNKWYPLNNGDVIRIGEYHLHFTYQFPPPTPPKDLSSISKIICDGFKNILPNYEEGKIIQYRDEHLHVLRTHLSDKDPCDAAEIAVLVGLELNDRRTEIDELIRSDEELNQKINIWAQQQQLLETAFRALVSIKHSFKHNLRAFVLKSDIVNFSNQLNELFKIFMNSYIELFQARSKFENETGFDVTRILHLSPNFVKSTNDVEKLAEYLLDWTDSEHAKHAVNALDIALHDLMLHEMGLLTGYQKAVPELCKNIFRELSYNHIQKKIASKLEIKLWNFTISFAFWPFTRIIYRNELSKMIQNLEQEDNSYYMNKFMDHFYNIYMELQRKRVKKL